MIRINEFILALLIVILGVGFILALVYHNEINEWAIRTSPATQGELGK